MGSGGSKWERVEEIDTWMRTDVEVREDVLVAKYAKFRREKKGEMFRYRIAAWHRAPLVREDGRIYPLDAAAPCFPLEDHTTTEIESKILEQRFSSATDAKGFLESAIKSPAPSRTKYDVGDAKHAIEQKHRASLAQGAAEGGGKGGGEGGKELHELVDAEKMKVAKDKIDTQMKRFADMSIAELDSSTKRSFCTAKLTMAAIHTRIMSITQLIESQPWPSSPHHLTSRHHAVLRECFALHDVTIRELRKVQKAVTHVAKAIASMDPTTRERIKQRVDKAAKVIEASADALGPYVSDSVTGMMEVLSRALASLLKILKEAFGPDHKKRIEESSRGVVLVFHEATTMVADMRGDVAQLPTCKGAGE